MACGLNLSSPRARAQVRARLSLGIARSLSFEGSNMEFNGDGEVLCQLALLVRLTIVAAWLKGNPN